MKISIKDLVTFTEEILNGKLHFLCSVLKVWTKFYRNYYERTKRKFWVKHEINPPLQRHFNNLAHILRNFAISSEILETYLTPGHFFAKGLNLPYLSKQKGWSDGAGGPVKS